MRFVIPLFSLILFACGGGAEPESAEPEGSPLASGFEGNYSVVAEESELRFSGTQEGTGFEGRFAEFDADILFDADDLDGSKVRVAIPLGSVEAGSTDRNSTLPQAVWFNSKAFPVAVFESDEIAATGDGYAAKGTLTLKGIEAPAVVFFTLEEDARGRAVMRGEAALDRTDWGIGEAPWDTEEYVGHTVELDILVVAEKT